MSHRIDNKIVLETAVTMAQRDGFNKLSRDLIAKEACVSNGKVYSAIGTMVKVRRAVMRYAIKHEMLDIIATGLGIKDPTAIKAPDEIKRQALETLLLT